MKPKTKTTLLFIGTLLIGIIIGILIGGSLHRMMEINFWEQTPQQRISGILKKELHLDASQQVFADSIINSRYQQIIRPPIDPDPMFFLFSNLEDELTPILNNDQKELLKQYITTMSRNMVAMRVAMIKERLNLTEQQEQRLQQLFLEMEKQFHHRRLPSPDSLRLKPGGFGGMADSFRVKFESVLTPKQLQQLQTQIFPSPR
jgi:hypothetical protein